MKLAGFTDIELHDVDEPKPKRFYERLIGIPHRRRCERKLRAAKTEEEKQFWTHASSDQSTYGRRLVVSAHVA